MDSKNKIINGKLNLQGAEKWEVYIIAVQLRTKMLSPELQLIKDRRYHLRAYPKCFVGRDVVTFLVGSGHCETRQAAVTFVSFLLESAIIHHVCDDHGFKDEMLFYRFREDDDTTPLDHDVQMLQRGMWIYLHIKKEGNLLGNHIQSTHIYREAFYGSDLITWLVSCQEAYSRGEGLRECRELLEHDIIRHITDDYHFRDARLLYQFKVDFERPRKLSELSSVLCYQMAESLRVMTVEEERIGVSRPRPISESSDGGRSTAASSSSSFSAASDPPSWPNSPAPASASNHYTRFQSLPSPSQNSSKSVLHHPVTVDDLESSDYIKIHVKVMSDSVGFGFVIRGEGPVYVQTVDPMGPAAGAGIKIRQFLHTVNGVNVLRYNHRQVAALILEHPTYVDLTIVVHKRDSGHVS